MSVELDFSLELDEEAVWLVNVGVGSKLAMPGVGGDMTGVNPELSS